MITLLAGDFMPGGIVLPPMNAPLLPGARLRILMQEAAHCIVNLECPFREDEQAPDADKTLLYAHASVVDQMRALGITAVNLANNHFLDYGPAAMGRTIAALKRAGIATFGAGENLAAAAAPLILPQTKGQDIVHLAFGWVPPRMQEGSAAATAESAGINPLWPDYVCQEIARWRDRGQVWAHLHWGEEFTRLPAPDQVAQALAFLKAGASLLVGHHPHIAQGLLPGANPVYFSLGNFLFAPRYSADGGRTQCLPDEGQLMKWPRHLYTGQIVLAQTGANGLSCSLRYVRGSSVDAAVDVIDAPGLHRHLLALGRFYRSRAYGPLHGILSWGERILYKLRKGHWEARDYGWRALLRKAGAKLRRERTP